MSFKAAEIYDGIEPVCQKRLNSIVEDNTMSRDQYDQAARDACQHSIAISLKRLADIVDWLQTAKLRGEL